jgi:hypothetical protein
MLLQDSFVTEFLHARRDGVDLPFKESGEFKVGIVLAPGEGG